MSRTLLAAFMLGALIAGIFVYWTVKPKPARVEQAALALPTPAPLVLPTVEPTPEPTPPPAPLPVARAARKPAALPAPKAAPMPTPAPAPTPNPVAAVASVPVPVAPPPPPEPAPAMVPDPPAPKPAPRQPQTAVIPAGTLITVRLNESLSSESNAEGYAFRATLDAPLIVNGLVIAERGTPQEGKVVAADKSGRVKGRARLALALTRLHTSDGQQLDIQTETFENLGESSTKKDAAKIGVAAGIGAAIGAIIGGGKGAAIGGAAGGAAGTGGVLATRGEAARLPSETRISFRLKEPLTLTEKL